MSSDKETKVTQVDVTGLSVTDGLVVLEDHIHKIRTQGWHFASHAMVDHLCATTPHGPAPRQYYVCVFCK